MKSAKMNQNNFYWKTDYEILEYSISSIDLLLEQEFDIEIKTVDNSLVKIRIRSQCFSQITPKLLPDKLR